MQSNMTPTLPLSSSRSTRLTDTEGHGKVDGLLSDALVAVDGPVGERTAHGRLAEGGDHCVIRYRKISVRT